MRNFNWKEKVKSVFFTGRQKSLLLLSMKDLNFLKNKKSQKDFKSRICIHNRNKDLIHEMIVFHKKGAYVRPHRHLNKLESFLILKGEIILVIFNNKGQIIKKIDMAAINSNKPFFYKMRKNYFHTQIIKKDTIFKEVTNGPFNKKKTLLAKWSPKIQDKTKVKDYLSYLKNH